MVKKSSPKVILHLAALASLYEFGEKQEDEWRRRLKCGSNMEVIK